MTWRAIALGACGGLLALTALTTEGWALTRVDSLRYLPTGRPSKPAIIYRYTYYASTQDEADVYHNYGQVRHRIEGRVTAVEKPDKSLIFSPHIKYINTRTDGTLDGFPGSRLLPTEFYELGMSAEYLVQTSGKGMFGLLADGVSASDKPFKSDTWAIDSTMFYRPGDGKAPGRTIYFVDWSTNRMILKSIPFPGFAYIADPSPELTVMAGFPILAIDARPTKEWTARTRFFLGKTLLVDAIYALSSSEALRFSFEWDIDVFLRHGRVDTAQRTVMLERRFGFDLIATVLPSFQIRIGGGYVSGRQVFEGTSLISTPEVQLKVQPTVFGAISGVLEL